MKALISAVISVLAVSAATPAMAEKHSAEDVIKSVQRLLAVPMKKTDYTGKVDLGDAESRECRVKFDLPAREIEVRYLLISEDKEQRTAPFKFGKNSVKKIETRGDGVYMKAERGAWLASATFEIWIVPVAGALEVKVRADGSGFMNQHEELLCQIPAVKN
jgi:hypothetical protein